MKELTNEQMLSDLVQPIRNWLAGNAKRNALVILSEPRATTHLVLASNTTDDDMIPDIGLIVGMEPQMQTVFSLIVDEAMGIRALEPSAPKWEDTVDYTATSSGRPTD